MVLWDDSDITTVFSGHKASRAVELGRPNAWISLTKALYPLTSDFHV